MFKKVLNILGNKYFDVQHVHKSNFQPQQHYIYKNISNIFNHPEHYKNKNSSVTQ
jgi:hypothetical protein